MDALAQQYLVVRQALNQGTRDPLSWFSFGVPRLRDALALFSEPDPIDELHLRACNKGGKSITVAAYVLACLQKRPELDGVKLPQWRGKVEGAQLVLDYPQQILSVQPAYEKLLGQWPHHARYKGEILSSLRVKPLNGSDDESTWSVLHFLSQENRRSGTGVRGDIIAFDEPPRIEILRELRKAAHAGRRSVTLIGETPTMRTQWAPLKEDYGECPRSSIRRVDEERAEVRWSLSEVGDWILPEREKAKLRRKYATDPLRDAREHGDYIDTSGDCPFHIPALLKMLEECIDPEEREMRIPREKQGETGLEIVQAKVVVHVLKDAKPGAQYYAAIDPSKGIATGNHDPGGILVSEMGTGEDVALYEGYLGSFGIGVLGAMVARQYNNAMVDFEDNGGWGEGVLRGLSWAGYGRIAKTRKALQPGKWEPRLGFTTTAHTRPTKIAAAQEWAESYAAGAPYAPCRFRRVIETLLDTIMDEDGKIVAAPGFHDEFLILKGQSLLKTRPLRPDSNRARAIEAMKPAPMVSQRTLSDIMGQPTKGPESNRRTIPTPKRGPRR